MSNINILFLADKKAKFRSQLDLAKNINHEFNVFFLLAFDEKLQILNISDAKALQSETILSTRGFEQKSSNNFLKIYIKKNIIMTVFYMVKISFLYRKLNKKLTSSNFDIFFVNGDRSGPSIETALLIFAKKNKIKVIIPYLSLIDSGKQERLKNKKLYSLNWIDKFFFGRNSRHTFYDKTIEYSFYNLPQYLALKFMNVITENPFSLGNNSTTDILCLDSYFTFKTLKDQSLFPHKIRFVGRPEYDFILQNRTEKRKDILFSLPQLYEHNLLDKKTHFHHIEKIIFNLNKSSSVKINLHPKCSINDYKYLESKYDCEISKNEIKKDIIKASTLVCGNSTIAIWGVLSGIKVIILNYLDLDCSMFKGLSSITYVDSPENLLNELNNSKPIDFTKDWELLGRDNLLQKTSKDNYNQIIKDLLSNDIQ